MQCHPVSHGFITFLMCVAAFHPTLELIDCDQCQPGWARDSGLPCKKIKTRMRKNIKDLSEDAWSSFEGAIEKMREDTTRFVYPPGTQFAGQPISTSFAYVLMHAQAILGSKYPHTPFPPIPNFPNLDVNYAHGVSAFPVWHRHFLLKFEAELHFYGMPKEMGIPYWNWTNEADTEKYVLTSDRFGGTGVPNQGYAIVDGFANDWKVMKADGTIGSSITRNIKGDPTATKYPNMTSVYNFLKARFYDQSPWTLSGYSPDRCRSVLEGLHRTNDVHAPDRSLHNLVHCLVGGLFTIGNTTFDGTMRDVTQSANDPLFWVHHAFVDLLFEWWLKRHPNATYLPIGYGSPGSCIYDCMPPFIPAVTPKQMMKPSIELGYEYDYSFDSHRGFSSGAIAGIVLGGISVIALAVGLLIYFRSPPANEDAQERRSLARDNQPPALVQQQPHQAPG